MRGTLKDRETEWDVMVDLYFYRDPEAEENKDALTDEGKVPEVDDVGPGAIDQGFAGNAEWEVPGGAPGGSAAFTSATNAGGAAAGSSWETDGADWAASAAPVQTGNDGWAGEGPKKEEIGW